MTRTEWSYVAAPFPPLSGEPRHTVVAGAPRPGLGRSGHGDRQVLPTPAPSRCGPGPRGPSRPPTRGTAAGPPRGRCGPRAGPGARPGRSGCRSRSSRCCSIFRWMSKRSGRGTVRSSRLADTVEQHQTLPAGTVWPWCSTSWVTNGPGPGRAPRSGGAPRWRRGSGSGPRRAPGAGRGARPAACRPSRSGASWSRCRRRRAGRRSRGSRPG